MSVIAARPVVTTCSIAVRARASSRSSSTRDASAWVDHHGERMRDDVVQLAPDATTFVGHGSAFGLQPATRRTAGARAPGRPASSAIRGDIGRGPTRRAIEATRKPPSAMSTQRLGNRAVREGDHGHESGAEQSEHDGRDIRPPVVTRRRREDEDEVDGAARQQHRDRGRAREARHREQEHHGGCREQRAGAASGGARPPGGAARRRARSCPRARRHRVPGRPRERVRRRSPAGVPRHRRPPRPSRRSTAAGLRVPVRGRPDAGVRARRMPPRGEPPATWTEIQDDALIPRSTLPAGGRAHLARSGEAASPSVDCDAGRVGSHPAVARHPEGTKRHHDVHGIIDRIDARVPRAEPITRAPDAPDGTHGPRRVGGRSRASGSPGCSPPTSIRIADGEMASLAAHVAGPAAVAGAALALGLAGVALAVLCSCAAPARRIGRRRTRCAALAVGARGHPRQHRRSSPTPGTCSVLAAVVAGLVTIAVLARSRTSARPAAARRRARGYRGRRPGLAGLTVDGVVEFATALRRGARRRTRRTSPSSP